MMRVRPSRWLLVLGVLAGCSRGPLPEVAATGSLPELRSAIEKRQKERPLNRDELRDLAAAVAERELTSSQGDEGVARVRELRTCLRPLEEAFLARATESDPGAAAATLALLDAQRVESEPFVMKHAQADQPWWLAVAARSALGKERAGLRREFFAHPDQRVRQGALHAAFAQPASEDLPALVEVARVDPDPLTRSLAIQTMGAIGGAQSVLWLRDLWPRQPDNMRQVIVSAWAHPNSLDMGGRERLVWTLETQGGLLRLVAARALLSDGRHGPQAISALQTALEQGTSDEMHLAVALLPLDESGRARLRAALDKLTPEARVLAWARLWEHPDSRAEAIKQLNASLGDESLQVASAARAALAAAGDRAIVPLAKLALKSESSEDRRVAALQLRNVGEIAAVAPVLADPAASVRTGVACAILADLDRR